MNRLTTEIFIKRSNIVHNNFYDYSITEYVNFKTKLNIICPIHGTFSQRADKHLNGNGCKKCGDEKRSIKNTFIERSNKIFNNKYDYSKVRYKNNKTKVVIICPIHGEFEKRPSNHLDRSGCPKCKFPKFSNNKVTNIESFIKKSNRIYNYKYDYSLSEYKGSKVKLTIICPIHGEFNQRPNDHLMNHGCSKCGGNKRKSTIQFIKDSNKVHNNFYDYSLSEYENNKSKVTIICPIHGKFEQRPDDHVNGKKCKKCSIDDSKVKEGEIIERFLSIHKGYYDYSNLNYKNTYSKVNIICPVHGEFIQSVQHHLIGKGCPKCKMSKGEVKIKNFLESNNIDYKYEKTFDNCEDIRKLRFDFYLPKFNICIEYNGIQHYQIVEHFGGRCGFEKRIYRDNLKKKFCEDNGINLLIIKYDMFNYIEDILKKVIYN